MWWAPLLGLQTRHKPGHGFGVRNQIRSNLFLLPEWCGIPTPLTTAVAGQSGRRKNTMTDEFPKDIDGEVIRYIAEDGNDLSKPMDVDFHVAAPTEDIAEKIADEAEKLGYAVWVEFDDGSEEELEEPVTEPWTCTCQKKMLLEYDAVIEAQKELDELSKPHGGYSDGWGTMGNAERSEEK